MILKAVADAAELVFITTPDAAIATVASQVKWHAGQSVVHCSGADSTRSLSQPGNWVLVLAPFILCRPSPV